MRLLPVRVGMSLTLTCAWDPSPPTRLPISALCEGLCLVLSHLVLLCLVDVTGRPVTFSSKLGEQWTWGREERGEHGGVGGRVGYSRNLQCKRRIKRKKIPHAHLAHCFQVKSPTTNNNHNNNTNQCFLIACASVVRYSRPC